MDINQFIEDATIVANVQVTHDTYEMILESPKIAATTKPGQFVMFTCSPVGTDPLLRRPLSVHYTKDDKVSLLYKVVGKGTELMRQMPVGTKASMLGPLGTGFKVAETENHILVGGGIGMAPLLHLSPLIQAQSKGKIHTLQGARSERDILVMDRFEQYGDTHISTDDGSAGVHGFVTEILQNIDIEDAAIYCCGPTPMMKAVAKIARQRNWYCQVSLEIEMACGMGACLGCAIPRLGVDEGVDKYLTVCKDGPALNAEEIWL